MTAYAVATPHPGEALATLTSPDGSWSRCGGLAMSACIHAAVVGLFILGLSQQIESIGGGGGGGSSNGSGLGESQMTLVHMPDAVPMMTAPEPLQPRGMVPTEAVPELLVETDANHLSVSQSLLTQDSLDRPLPNLQTLSPSDAPIGPTSATAPALPPPPQQAAPPEGASKPFDEAPSPLHAFAAPSPVKLRAMIAELKPQAEEVAQLQRLETENLEQRAFDVQPNELRPQETDPLAESDIEAEQLDGATDPASLTDAELMAFVEPDLEPPPLSLEAAEADNHDLVPPAQIELAKVQLTTSLTLVETEPEEQQISSLAVPPSKPDRQVTLPEVRKRAEAKQQVVRTKIAETSEPQRSASLNEVAAKAVKKGETRQSGGVVEQSGQGQSQRAGGNQQAGRAGAGGQGPSGAGAGPSGSEMNSYASQLAAWLERHKRYPRSSRRRGEQGVVTLQFTLDTEGHVVKRRILRSSGHERLDREVLALLERASPMPRPPGNAPRFSLAVPIVFSLR